MGFDAGSRLGGGDSKPGLFKWEIQHLLKSMGFDAGSGSEVLMGKIFTAEL